MHFHPPRQSEIQNISKHHQWGSIIANIWNASPLEAFRVDAFSLYHAVASTRDKAPQKKYFLLPLYPKQHCMKWENINSLGVCLSLPSMAIWDTARLRALHCPRLLLLAFFFLLSDWWVTKCPWCWSCWSFGNSAFPGEGRGCWVGFFSLGYGMLRLRWSQQNGTGWKAGKMLE